MAENQWGKSPPKGKSFLSPDMLKESFWGPAEVPDQVRGTPRVTVWGGPRPWEPGERPESIPAGEHDSWVSGEAKKGTMQSEFEGTDLELSGSTYEAEGIEPGEADSNESTVREQGPGDADSWVGGEAKKGTMQSEFKGTDLELSGSTNEVEGLEKPEKGDPNEPTIREQGPGDADSWVGGEVKKGTMQSSFEGTDLELSGSTNEVEGLKKPEKGDPNEPTIREQGPGDADSWVGGEAKKGTMQSAFKGTKLDLDMDSWVGKFTEKDFGEKPTNKQREEIEKDKHSTSLFANAFTLDPEQSIADMNSQDFDAPLATFDAPVGGGNFDPNGGFGNSSLTYAGDSTDPFVGGWNFRVKIDNIPETHSKFVSISGLTMETENIEFKYGGDAFMRRIPGKEKFGEVELTRVFQLGSSGFSSWRKKISQGSDDRRDVTIQVFHTNFNQKVLEVKLMDAYISKWEAPELNAGSSDGATEKITLIPHHIIVNDGATSADRPNSGRQLPGALEATPEMPLSLEDYYKQLQENLDAAMGRMGTANALEDSRARLQKLDEERKAQAEKAAEFRKKQKSARDGSSNRDKLKADLEAGRKKREEMNDAAEAAAEKGGNAKA